MTMLTIAASTSSSTSIAVGPGLSASNTDAPRGVPASIRADEAYYWSTRWQDDVKEALAARRAGDSARFDSDDPDDVVRWLLSVDDDE